MALPQVYGLPWLGDLRLLAALGLPFVRTSPDHGTAFDIAGRGIADPSSTIAALRLAWNMASVRISGEAAIA